MVLSGASPLVFEGATDDANETTLAFADPTTDRTITFPNATGTIVLEATGSTLTNKSIDLGNNTISGSLAEFNTALQDDSFVGLAATQTLTNKTLTSPKIGTNIQDTNGNELITLTATSSAVNEVTYANAATGNNPSITASGGDTNIGIDLKTKGSGVIKAEDGDGNVAAVKIAGKESIWIPAVAMYPNTTDGAGAISQTELSNGPELKALPFDKTSDEFAQFAIAFPNVDLPEPDSPTKPIVVFL